MKARSVVSACAALSSLASAQNAQASESEKTSPAWRITAEVGGGVVGIAAGGLVGGAIGAASCGSRGEFTCLGAASLGVAAGGFAGLGLGVWGGGGLADGNGGLGYTYLGALSGGAALGLGALVFDALDWDLPGAATFALVVAIPLGFAIAGYELSHESEPEHGGARTSTPLTLTLPLAF